MISVNNKEYFKAITNETQNNQRKTQKKKQSKQTNNPNKQSNQHGFQQHFRTQMPIKMKSAQSQQYGTQINEEFNVQMKFLQQRIHSRRIPDDARSKKNVNKVIASQHSSLCRRRPFSTKGTKRQVIPIREMNLKLENHKKIKLKRQRKRFYF